MGRTVRVRPGSKGESHIVVDWSFLPWSDVCPAGRHLPFPKKEHSYSLYFVLASPDLYCFRLVCPEATRLRTVVIRLVVQYTLSSTLLNPSSVIASGFKKAPRSRRHSSFHSTRTSFVRSNPFYKQKFDMSHSLTILLSVHTFYVGVTGLSVPRTILPEVFSVGVSQLRMSREIYFEFVGLWFPSRLRRGSYTFRSYVRSSSRCRTEQRSPTPCWVGDAVKDT